MGACCELFNKNNADINDSRMKLLETKVEAKYHGPFDE